MGKRNLPLAHFSDLTASPNDRFAPEAVIRALEAKVCHRGRGVIAKHAPTI